MKGLFHQVASNLELILKLNFLKMILLWTVSFSDYSKPYNFRNLESFFDQRKRQNSMFYLQNLVKLTSKTERILSNE